MNIADLVGWLATIFFIVSYFLDSKIIKIVQTFGCLLWIIYGILIKKSPIIVANICVLLAAIITYFNLHNIIIGKLRKQNL